MIIYWPCSIPILAFDYQTSTDRRNNNYLTFFRIVCGRRNLSRIAKLNSYEDLTGHNRTIKTSITRDIHQKGATKVHSLWKNITLQSLISEYPEDASSTTIDNRSAAIEGKSLSPEGSDTSPSSRIVQGRVSTVHEFPWLVLLEYPRLEGVHCTGSLITSKHVLTAAHCIDQSEKLTLMLKYFKITNFISYFIARIWIVLTKSISKRFWCIFFSSSRHSNFMIIYNNSFYFHVNVL